MQDLGDYESWDEASRMASVAAVKDSTKVIRWAAPWEGDENVIESYLHKLSQVALSISNGSNPHLSADRRVAAESRA